MDISVLLEESGWLRLVDDSPFLGLETPIRKCLKIKNFNGVLDFFPLYFLQLLKSMLCTVWHNVILEGEAFCRSILGICELG